MARRVWVSALGVAVYLVGRTVSLPFLDLPHVSLIENLGLNRNSLFGVGLFWFLAGFVVVELFSLLTPVGRRLRRRGVAGRATLNQAGLAVGSVLALFQAGTLAHHARALMAPHLPIPATTAPFWLLFSTLAAGAFATLGLAELISAWGIGNGLVLLAESQLAAQVLAVVLRPAVTGHFVPTVEQWGAKARRWPVPVAEAWLPSVLWTAAFLAIAWLILTRPRIARMVDASGEDLELRVPTFPQGVEPSYWTPAVGALIFALPGLHGRALLAAGGAPLFVVYSILFLALSALFGWIFSSREWLSRDLEGVAAPVEGTYRSPWFRQLVLTAAVMLAAEASERWGGSLLPTGTAPLFGLPGAVVFVAVALDLIEEGRLLRRGPVERVLTLDNVHLAEYFRARFEREGIPLAIRAFQFRRLTYYFGPLFKMALLVPAAERDRAAALVEATDFRIV